MLSLSESTGGVKTVQLARGHASSPARPPGSAPIRRYSEKNTDALPSQESSTQDHSHMLAQIGIFELLQQDERPTFIIDVADTGTFQPGLSNVVFANPALAAQPGLLELIRGTSDDPSKAIASTTAFVEFKQWALSFIKDGQALPLPLPSYAYAGSVWTSLDLRKRFRVISCNQNSAPATADGSPGGADMRYYKGLGSSTLLASTNLKQEASGYFDPVNTAQISNRSALAHHLARQDSTEAATKKQRLGSEPVQTRVNHHGIDSMGAVLSPGSPAEPTEPILSIERSASYGSIEIHNVIPDRGFFDWTRLPETSALPPHIRYARSVDWAATSLGPIESWDADLRAMCNLVMASPHPAAMYWGPDLIAIYNEAYILLAGSKHPWLMGQSYKEAWGEIWDAVKDVFASAQQSAQATMKDDDCLFMNRDGFLEETYFSWSIIPLIGADGSVVGLYNPAFEKTRRKIAERRMLTLRDIGEKTAAARAVSQFWPFLLQGLEYNELDAPFVLLYSVADDIDSDASSMQSNSMVTQKTLLLEGALGVPVGHQAAPDQIDLSKSTQGFAPVFRDAVKSNKTVILSEKDGSLDMELLEGIQWRGYGDPSSAVVICPIHPTTGESTLGFLVLGTNPRRPYDEDYDLFIQLLSRQLATSVASVVLFEEEIRRGERAARLAAQDRIELSKQLAARTQEAVESEIKFTRMAELAPVGMFIADATGGLNYCNDAWYDLSSYPKGEPVGDDWMEFVCDDDRPETTKAWRQIIEENVPISIEFRFKTPWEDKEGNRLQQTWVLASAYPEKCEDGQVKRIFGSVTDISTQKFAQQLQKRRMEEAVEMKRQQENFIDMTSHEMRNPLSAILQCADEISTSLMEAKDAAGPQINFLESNIDAAQTITLCAQHQKRIVDDILTLSKLDSARLLVTPVDVQPAGVMQRALKMFEGELQTADISLDFLVDGSLRDLRAEWVRLDPSRLLQVLINLTTNAIKFTSGQEERAITVTLGATLERPSEREDHTVDYVPTRNKAEDTTSGPEWGTGEVVYITFAIKDTGRGLNESEKKLLFHRFSQASPRTHVTYGGSGLGLFISKILVELQGGEIGVSSESGRGSTFAFYVKARRSSTPSEDADHSLNGAQVSEATGAKGSGRHVQDHRVVVRTHSAAAPPLATTGSAEESPLKVLIVEDNLVNQKVLAKQLQKVGCITYLANHGGEAIDQLMNSTFWTDKEATGTELDVILMDLEMPVMDGLTCTRRIRELQASERLVKHVPVIAVTANAREEQIAATIEAGVDEVMPKPFRIPDLLPKIRTLADRNRGESRTPI